MKNNIRASERLESFARIAEDTRENVKVISGNDSDSDNEKEERLSEFSRVIRDTEKQGVEKGSDDNEKEERLSEFSRVIKESEKQRVEKTGDDTEKEERLSDFGSYVLKTEKKAVEDKVSERGKDYTLADLGIKTIRESKGKQEKTKEIKRSVEAIEPFKERKSEFDNSGIYFRDDEQDAVGEDFVEGLKMNAPFFFSLTDGKKGARENEISLGQFTLTAYDACIICCGKTDGITATGTKAEVGRTIAVDPLVIPYGTRVRIGNNIFIAEDTGSKVKGKHIDIFMETHEIAKQFGKKQGEVFLVR